ncbi:MAG: hypothetical protein R2818_05865 [Flavobacteriales bacterium]
MSSRTQGGITSPLCDICPEPRTLYKILIIDDEKAIRAALRDILEHEKHSVEEAEDGVGPVWLRPRRGTSM